MPEFFTDLETLAKSTGLIRGEIAFVLWANGPPKILIPHSERGDIDSSKCSVDCSLTVEVVTEALRGEWKGMESDLVMDGRMLDTWAQFRPQVGDEAMVIRLQGLIAVKSTGISDAKTYALNTHRVLGLSGRTTGRFVELCRKNHSVEAYFMAPSNQPRLKGKTSIQLSREALSALDRAAPQKSPQELASTKSPKAWWRFWN